MNIHDRFMRYIGRFKLRKSIAAAALAAGIVVGIFFCLSSPELFIDFARAALTKPARPYSLFLVNGLPVAAVLFFLSRRMYAFCYPLLLWEGIGYGFCGMLFGFIGNASWILRLLFLFSGSNALSLMLYFIFHYVDHVGFCFSKAAWLAAIYTCCVSLLDIYLISPVLTDLASYI